LYDTALGVDVITAVAFRFDSDQGQFVVKLGDCKQLSFESSNAN
jgi:hypothetical protein